MNYDSINENNYLIFCATHYKNATYVSTEDFLEDLNRIKYIKKLITRYIENGELKERLILNHIIILNNVFGPEILCKILYLKLKAQIKYIKPFLVFLNILTDRIYNVGDEKLIFTDVIEMDQSIINTLRTI